MSGQDRPDPARSGKPTCPTCGDAVSTYGVHRRFDPHDASLLPPTRLHLTEQHVWLSPCGCRFRVERFVATFNLTEELIGVSGVPLGQ